MHLDEVVNEESESKGKNTSSRPTSLRHLSSTAALADSIASRFWRYSADELRCLDKQTLHALLSSPSLSIETEDALLQLLIDIDCETFDFWRYIEVSLLSSKGFSQYVERLPFDRLTSEMWGKLICHFHGVSLDDLRLRRFYNWTGFSGHSEILANIPTPLKQFEDKKWKLIYRGSRHGFRGFDFHRLCDGCANTVTLILTTNGSIFGGFTVLRWSSSGATETDTNRESFLFTVTDTRGGPPSKFPLAPNPPNPVFGCVPGQNAIMSNQSYGPAFGRQDLCVSDYCNTARSTCSGQGTYWGAQGPFIGERGFIVKEIEVLSIDR
jgi:hypothetical protein